MGFGPEKRVQNMWPLGDGTHRRAQHGTHRSNQLGSRLRFIPRRFSPCSPGFRPLLFEHGSEFPAGMPTKFGAATARIHDTGRRWPNSLVFPRMPDSPARLPPIWESETLRTKASAKEPRFGVHLAADYGPKRSNSDRLAGSCLTTSHWGD
jgi:hypothetical protein